MQLLLFKVELGSQASGLLDLLRLQSCASLVCELFQRLHFTQLSLLAPDLGLQVFMLALILPLLLSQVFLQSNTFCFQESDICLAFSAVKHQKVVPRFERYLRPELFIDELAHGLIS